MSTWMPLVSIARITVVAIHVRTNGWPTAQHKDSSCVPWAGKAGHSKIAKTIAQELLVSNLGRHGTSESGLGTQHRYSS